LNEAPGDTYRRLEAENGRQLAHARRLSDRLVTSRVSVFVLAGAAMVLGDVLDGVTARVSLSAGLLLGGVFLVLVVVHRRVRAGERRHVVMSALAREGLHRLGREWDALPRWPETPPGAGESDHPYAGDLDLFGRASLAALCGPVTTAPGRRTLAAWLLGPAASDEVLQRQAAVRELAPALKARLAFAAVAGRTDPPTHAATEALLGWAEEPPRLLSVRWLAWASWLLPAALAVFAWLHLSGATGAFWLVPFALQLWILRSFGRAVAADFGRAEGAAASLATYAEQIRLVSAWPVEAPRLVALRALLEGEGESAADRLERLGKVIEWVESRRNPVYQLGGLLLLLDLHVHRALERWKVESGAHMRGWLAALGETEALSALACLAYDHPDWRFPAPAPAGEPIVTARALGHPLLLPDVAVRNDVQVGPPGTFLLVTGSNMSGKSTLLRALGSNCVLAGAGAPVCAESLRLPDVLLHTSIRVQDSLEQGISLFMAELLSLSRVVQAARAAKAQGRTVLYLLDEVLQGTNSGDRRVAARTVLRHLLDAGAIGAVTTHDLSLAAAPELEARAVPVHFSETALRAPDGRPRLSFDYRLKPGLATTRNALLLLEMVGLGAAEEDAATAEAQRDG
jgi:hypothetical protein